MTLSNRNTRYIRVICLIISIFFTLLLVKYIWVNNKCAHIGSFETEYEDITQRRNYLIEKIIVSPDKLLEEMPAAVGPTTVDQHIELLRSRGMDIEDEVKAKEILLDVGYYRLGFYWYPFERDNKCKNRSHEFIEGASFKDAVDLYYFDYQLKNIILKYISRIEINLRTKLIYIVSNQYPDSPTWFADPSIVNHKHVKDIVQNYTTELLKHNPVLRAHHKKYINDKYAPAWKTIEFMPLGA